MSERAGVFLLSIAVGLVASAGCDADGAAGGVAVRDSAGIEIVESRGPSELPATAWRVTDAPVVRIGSREGAEPDQLTRVGAATRLSDGRIVVLERSVELLEVGSDYLLALHLDEVDVPYVEMWGLERGP